MERSTVGSILRTSQAYCGQLCEKQTLQYGIAYYCKRFAALPEANQFREVIVDGPARLPDALAEADAFFTQHRLFCRRWAPADGTASDALAAFLARQGFRRRDCSAMVLADWVDIDVPDSIRVLPARAMRAAVRETFLDAEEPKAPRLNKLAADACLERMDDATFDMFVAMIGDQTAGRCALYQVGDIARIVDLAVRPPFVDRGVDRALLAHVLAMAKRLTIRNNCMQIDHDDPRRDWLEAIGFVSDGTIVEFERDAPSGSEGAP